MHCDDKRRLLDAYKSAVERYSATVADLDIVRGKVTKVEYMAIFEASERARHISELARLALEEHSVEHGC